MYRLNVQVTACTDDKLALISSWSVHATHYKMFGAAIISLERLNIKCRQILYTGRLCRYINSSNRMTYRQQKGVVICSLSWCSASRGSVSDSWATCFLIRLLGRPLRWCSYRVSSLRAVCFSEQHYTAMQLLFPSRPNVFSLRQTQKCHHFNLYAGATYNVTNGID